MLFKYIFYGFDKKKKILNLNKIIFMNFQVKFILKNNHTLSSLLFL